MKPYRLLILMPFLLLGACQTEPAADQDQTPAAYAETLTVYDIFGEPFATDDALPVQTVAATPADYTGRTILIEGTVAEVCQAAGCWLTLQVPGGDNIRIVVPRDDDGAYVFTVAKDLSGRRAVVQGTLAEAQLSEHDQHHMAEDAGHDAAHHEAPAPKPELQLTASGVLVEKG